MMTEKKKGSAASVHQRLAFNPTQCSVITSFLYHKGLVTSEEISMELSLSKSAVARALKTLISAKIVVATKDATVAYRINDDVRLNEALKLLDSLSGGGASYETKQRLTLAMSKGVIERAKAHGINISAIIEEFLKAVTYENFDRASQMLPEGYLALFEAIMPVVQKYNLEVEVGRMSGLTESGKTSLERIFVSNKVNLPILRTDKNIYTVKYVTEYLYSPSKVLENLIEAVLQTSQKDKLKLHDLEISLRVVKAIFSTED